jgi:hypothetical protein
VGPGATTRLAGGFEITSVTGTISDPISGAVVIASEALRLPGGRPVGFTTTLNASGACPDAGVTVIHPDWLRGVPGGYAAATETTVEVEAEFGSETVILAAAGSVVVST